MDESPNHFRTYFNFVLHLAIIVTDCFIITKLYEKNGSYVYSENE